MLQEEEPELATFHCTYRSLTSALLWEVRWGDLRAALAGQPAAGARVSHAALRRVSAHMAQFPHVWAGSSFKVRAGWAAGRHALGTLIASNLG